MVTIAGKACESGYTSDIWWAITISIVAELLILLPWYLRGGWARREIRVNIPEIAE